MRGRRRKGEGGGVGKDRWGERKRRRRRHNFQNREWENCGGGGGGESSRRRKRREEGCIPRLSIRMVVVRPCLAVPYSVWEKYFGLLVTIAITTASGRFSRRYRGMIMKKSK